MPNDLPPDPPRPAPVLAYRRKESRPGYEIRPPQDVAVPYSVGAALGASIGAVAFGYRFIAGWMDFLAIFILVYAGVSVTMVILTTIAIAIWKKWSRQTLSAAPSGTCFWIGILIGVFVPAVGWMAARQGRDVEEYALLVLAYPLIAGIGAAVVLVRPI